MEIAGRVDDAGGVRGDSGRSGRARERVRDAADADRDGDGARGDARGWDGRAGVVARIVRVGASPSVAAACAAEMRDGASEIREISDVARTRVEEYRKMSEEEREKFRAACARLKEEEEISSAVARTVEGDERRVETRASGE